MKIVIKKNLWSGIVTVLVSIILWITLPYCIKTQVTSLTAAIGPDYLPRLMIAMMGFCGIGLVITSIIFKKDDEIEIDLKSELRTVVFVIMILGYILLMQIIGFLLATIIFSCGALFFMETKKPMHYAVVIILSVLIFVSFKYGLRVSLPTLIF